MQNVDLGFLSGHSLWLCQSRKFNSPEEWDANQVQIKGLIPEELEEVFFLSSFSSWDKSESRALETVKEMKGKRYRQDKMSSDGKLKREVWPFPEKKGKGEEDNKEKF